MTDLAALSGLGSTSLPSSAGEARAMPTEQFESIFYSIMIKQMRETLSENGLFPGEKTDSYGSLFDMYMSQHLAESQPLGFARMIDRYQQTKAQS